MKEIKNLALNVYIQAIKDYKHSLRHNDPVSAEALINWVKRGKGFEYWSYFLDMDLGFLKKGILETFKTIDKRYE